MSNEKLKLGEDLTVHRLICPYCDLIQETDEADQYHCFDLKAISKDGLRRVWECTNCGERFRTRRD